MIEHVEILNVPIAAVNMDAAVGSIEAALESGQRNYITVTSVHGIIESQDDPELLAIHQRAYMCLPDGMPTVWIGRLHGHRRMSRVNGPELMLEVLGRSAGRGYRHFFVGGKDGVAELLKKKMVEKFPGLKVVGTYCPPFREMRQEELAELLGRIESARPDIIWVGLSTPKQERWMHGYLDLFPARLMIGVGAAFDFNSGLLKTAPGWMKASGLEWLFRLIVEPRRLWRRYFHIVPRFIFLIGLQLAGIGRGRR